MDRRDFWRSWRRREFHKERERRHAWREHFREHMGTMPEHHWAFRGRRFRPWHQGRDAFNPFVAGLLSKGGGLLPALVLSLLEQKPRYGNEIMDIISERTRGRWRSNPGAIYPLMTMLEENELITGEWEDPEKRTVRMYRLTDRGRDELKRMRTIIGPKLVEAAEIISGLARDLNGTTDDDNVTYV